MVDDYKPPTIITQSSVISHSSSESERRAESDDYQSIIHLKLHIANDRFDLILGFFLGFFKLIN
jgi:hypothetical protein